MATPTQDPASRITAPAMTPPAQSAATQPTVAPAAQFAPSAPTPPPQPTAAPGLAPAASPAPSTAPPGVALAGITPGQDLRGQTVLPTAGPDRFQMAQDKFNTFAEQTQPQFDAGLRSATQKASANGAIGSGMLQTDYGNLTNQRDLNLRGERSGLLQNALDGTINDARNNRDEVRGERGYENALENQAYGRGVQQIGLEDQLTNSAYGRGAGSLAAGSAGNPGATQLGLSQIAGQQSSDAGTALGAMVQQNASNGILSGLYGQKPQPSSGPATGTSPNNSSILDALYGPGNY